MLHLRPGDIPGRSAFPALLLLPRSIVFLAARFAEDTNHNVPSIEFNSK